MATQVVTDDPIINAQTQSATVWAIAISFSLASFIAVALRLYTRCRIVKRPGSDDATIVVAEVFALLTAIGASMEGHYGLGRHIWTISKEDFFLQQTWLYAVIIFYNLTCNIIKLSFLLQYRRFLTGVWTIRICNWSAFVFLPALTVLTVTLMATACFPVTVVVPSMVGRCLPQTPVWYFVGITSLVTDFLVFLIPLPTIFKLRIPNKKQKILLIMIFSLGLFTCAIGIIRVMQYSNRLKTTDTSWTGVATSCWCMVEIHCGILCSCLPTLRPLFRRVFPWLGGSSMDPNSGRQYGGLSGAAPIQSKRRTTAAWETERRPSFGSAEALKDHYACARPVELTSWAEGRRSAGAEESSEALDRAETLEDAKALQIYVRQTFEAKETRAEGDEGKEKDTEKGLSHGKEKKKGSKKA